MSSTTLERTRQMDGYRVLIVEDDPLVSSHLESIIMGALEAEVAIASSVAEADAALAQPFDFACLDVDVLDGTTYAFASTLSARGIPFTFISASNRDLVPHALRHVPFIAKPYSEIDIIGMLREHARPA